MTTLEQLELEQWLLEVRRYNVGPAVLFFMGDDGPRSKLVRNRVENLLDEVLPTVSLLVVTPDTDLIKLQAEKAIGVVTGIGAWAATPPVVKSALRQATTGLLVNHVKIKFDRLIFRVKELA